MWWLGCNHVAYKKRGNLIYVDSFTWEQAVEKAPQYFNDPDMLTSIDDIKPYGSSYGNNSSSWGTWEGKYSTSEIIDIIRNM